MTLVLRLLITTETAILIIITERITTREGDPVLLQCIITPISGVIVDLGTGATSNVLLYSEITSQQVFFDSESESEQVSM